MYSIELGAQILLLMEYMNCVCGSLINPIESQINIYSAHRELIRVIYEC